MPAPTFYSRPMMRCWFVALCQCSGCNRYYVCLPTNVHRFGRLGKDCVCSKCLADWTKRQEKRDLEIAIETKRRAFAMRIREEADRRGLVVCITCKKPLPPACFHKDRRSSNGLCSSCTSCTREYRKAYYQTHREQEKARSCEWGRTNPEKRKEQRNRSRSKIKAQSKREPSRDIKISDDAVDFFTSLTMVGAVQSSIQGE